MNKALPVIHDQNGVAEMLGMSPPLSQFTVDYGQGTLAMLGHCLPNFGHCTEHIGLVGDEALEDIPSSLQALYLQIYDPDWMDDDYYMGAVQRCVDLQALWLRSQRTDLQTLLDRLPSLRYLTLQSNGMQAVVGRYPEIRELAAYTVGVECFAHASWPQLRALSIGVWNEAGDDEALDVQARVALFNQNQFSPLQHLGLITGTSEAYAESLSYFLHNINVPENLRSLAVSTGSGHHSLGAVAGLPEASQLTHLSILENAEERTKPRQLKRVLAALNLPKLEYLCLQDTRYVMEGLVQHLLQHSPALKLLDFRTANQRHHELVPRVASLALPVGLHLTTNEQLLRYDGTEFIPIAQFS